MEQSVQTELPEQTALQIREVFWEDIIYQVME
jgi:hypothetical protein